MVDFSKLNIGESDDERWHSVRRGTPSTRLLV